MTTKDSRILKTGDTMLTVVDLLKERDGARVEEVASRLDISPSTAYRHLNTLAEHGYVVNEGDRYRLGMRFLAIGGYTRNEKNAYNRARNTIEELAEETGERAQFIVEEHGRRITVHMESGEKAVQAGKNIGYRGYLHSSSAGKAILAKLSDDRVREIIDQTGLPQQTDHSITSQAELLEELDEIREQGFALNDQESTVGLRAVGTTVSYPDDRLLGAISVSGPKNRIKNDLFRRELPELLSGKANELELKVEYDEP